MALLIPLTPRTPRVAAGPRPAVARLVERALLLVQGALALAAGYLLALLLAARAAERGAHERPLAERPSRLRMVVLVPAHDEEEGIGQTLRSLDRCDYPAEAWRKVVIADNCADLTADRAAEAGAEVWTRTNPAARGKGQALTWALERLWSDGREFDAVVIVDADCIVSPNLLSAIEARMCAGAGAVQVDDVVGNLDASHASALRYAAFVLMVRTRFAGKQRLGLSCGLVGTGMAFSKELLDREPWTATSLGEDGEYHMRLVRAGERVEFAADAWVRSAMPTSLRKSNAQQARWEKGKLHLVRHWTPRLVAAGLARRDIVRVHAGLEHLVPPQSLIAAGGLGSTLAGLLLGSRRLLAVSVAALAAQLAFVLGGLRLARVPLRVYRALLLSPALIASKVLLYVRLLSGRGPTAWVRTQRESGNAPADRVSS